MKRAAAFFIEEIGYSVCMIIVLKQYTERFEGDFPCSCICNADSCLCRREYPLCVSGNKA